MSPRWHPEAIADAEKARDWYAERSATASNESPTMLGWLVPISGGEADVVEQRGVDAFETILSEVTADLADLGRQSLV